MHKIRLLVIGIFFFGAFTAIVLYPLTSLACSAWTPQDSECVYGDSQNGALWTRSCPETVCHRDGKFITNMPCDNEDICMPETTMDGPTLPGTDTQLPVHTNPNHLRTICQKWYPMNGDNSQLDGCPNGQIEWSRVCQKYDPQMYPTQTCSAGYPGDN